MMKPAVTNPALRRLRFVFTLASCLLTFVAFSQNPVINGETAVCQGSEYTYYTPFTLNNTYSWSVSAGGVITQNNNNSITVRWLGAQNSSQIILVTETAPGMAGVTAQEEVFIKNNQLSCNNNVNTSLDLNGQALITPDMLLEGTFNTYDGYTVSLSYNGIQYGNTIGCDQVGLLIVGLVTDECTGNSCWGTLTVEDKTAPTWTCPTTPITIPCDMELDSIPHPPVYDNCTADPLIAQTGVTIDNSDICSGVTITRTFVATDDFDWESTCTQVLQISPDDQEVVFPDDVFISCSQYSQYPNLTDPTPLSGDVSISGAGVPVANSGPYCIFNVNSHDDTLANCGGNTFKIVRTWTVLNWCTGQIVTMDDNGEDNEQIIKIIDLTKPTMTLPTDVVLEVTEGNGSALTCISEDYLPPPIFYFDDCGEVSIRIFTPVGEAEYVNGVDGAEGGYVPHPGLHVGTHTILYKAIDGCGNVRELGTSVVVTDVTPPVTICDEITDVNLNESGTATVFATTFNDGSTDNCCIEQYLVKRMDEPDFNFAPSVTFDCTDSVEMVVMRAVDCFGNYNDCMVTALVSDKMLPTCVPPDQKIIPCVQLPADITDDYVHGLGEAFSFDNCESTVEELPYTMNIDNCGEGHIIRKFQAVDGQGNVSGNYCEQHIYITPASDWLISFPPNWSGECGDSISAPELELGNFACDMFAVSVEDQYFGLSNDSACFKIVRTWKVINWCGYDEDLDPIIIPTNEFGVEVDEEEYNNFGQYEYQQIIKIIDHTPPALSYTFNPEFCTEDDDCATGAAYLPLVIDGECTTDFDIVHQIDLGRNGVYEYSGSGFFEGILPIGDHRIHYVVQDGCTNEAEITIDFSVVDCKKPTAVCSNGLIVELMQTGMVDICAQQLDEYSFDNCPGPFKFSFSSDVSDECRTFDCFDTGQNSVQMWVTDAAGNQDFCENFIVIQDNMFSCVGDPIVGALVTENDLSLEGASVHLNSDMGTETAISDADGMYEFLSLEHGHDYTVTPEKDDEPLNGVTTYDIVLISKHILNIQPLDSPYKMIAADVNNSQTITTFDLVSLRKLVLFIDLEFQSNTSWRFVEAGYDFPNPQDPWEEVFPEVVNANNFDGAISDANFVAVKIGDVNGTAVTTADFSGDSVGDRFEKDLLFHLEDRWVEAGENVEVELKAMNFNDIYGFQFTFDFDTQSLDFQSIGNTSLTDTENYGLALLAEGAITALWFEPEMKSLHDGEPVLSLSFTATQSGQLSNLFSVSSRFTNAEAYVGEDMETYGVNLDFDGVSSTASPFAAGYQLYQNVPNPFTNRTAIGFDLPQANTATVTVFDSAGRTVWTTAGQFAEGYNEVTLDAKDLPANAALFYKIESGNFSAIRQMTVVR